MRNWILGFVSVLTLLVNPGPAWAVVWLPPVNITNNSFNDYHPRISGSNVVWEGFDGNDWEVFMSTASSAVAPEPASQVIWSLIGFVGIGIARYGRRTSAG